jgi:hypothetical protein
MTLRSRANHLLEFVTDPVASTPAPMVTHSQTASRFDKPGSRLDALDASHVVISTANLLGEPVGFAGRRNGHETTANGKQDQGTAEVKHEDGDGSSMADDDDFQDVEEDEEDESIRTRKGVTSHKTQPGGGRNLDLLKGLAAADPSADSPSGADDSLSIYPSGIDSKDDMSASRRSMDRSSGTPATPSTVPKSVNDLSDLISGALPGEGSALVARRAAADSLSMHSRRAVCIIVYFSSGHLADIEPNFSEVTNTFISSPTASYTLCAMARSAANARAHGSVRPPLGHARR